MSTRGKSPYFLPWWVPKKKASIFTELTLWPQCCCRLVMMMCIISLGWKRTNLSFKPPLQKIKLTACVLMRMWRNVRQDFHFLSPSFSGFPSSLTHERSHAGPHSRSGWDELIHKMFGFTHNTQCGSPTCTQTVWNLLCSICSCKHAWSLCLHSPPLLSRGRPARNAGPADLPVASRCQSQRGHGVPQGCLQWEELGIPHESETCGVFLDTGVL